MGSAKRTSRQRRLPGVGQRRRPAGCHGARRSTRTTSSAGFKSSTLVDLFAGYDWQNYSFELFATNVFDERNELSRFVGVRRVHRLHIIPGRPRTIGMRVGTQILG